jgi:hypothetical protein
MSIPAGFPYPIGANPAWGGAQDGSGGNSDVLVVNTSVRFWVGFNFNTSVIEAYKSSDIGATWALVATGPAFATDPSGTSLTYQYGSASKNDTAQTIVATYWSTGLTIAAVVFDCNVGVESFGSELNSGVTFFGTTISGGVVSPVGFFSALRPIDNVLWVMFPGADGDSTGATPPWQNVYVLRLNVTATTWGSPIAIASDVTGNRWDTSSMGIDVVNNLIWGLVFRVNKPVPSTIEELLAFTIDHLDNVSGLTSVATGAFTRSGKIDNQSLAVPLGFDTVNQKVLLTFATGTATPNITHIAYGDLSGFSVSSAPSGMQPPSSSFNYSKAAVIVPAGGGSLALNWAFGSGAYGQAYWEIVGLPAGWYFVFQFYMGDGTLQFYYLSSVDSGTTWTRTNYATLSPGPPYSSGAMYANVFTGGAPPPSGGEYSYAFMGVVGVSFAL